MRRGPFQTLWTACWPHGGLIFARAAPTTPAEPEFSLVGCNPVSSRIYGPPSFAQMTGRSETTFKYVVWENSLQTWMNGNGTFYIWNLMFKDCSPKFHYDPAKVTMGPYFESSTIVCGKRMNCQFSWGMFASKKAGIYWCRDLTQITSRIAPRTKKENYDCELRSWVSSKFRQLTQLTHA